MSTLSGLANTMFEQGDLAGAREVQERVLGAYERILGHEHTNTLLLLQNLAVTLRAQGDLTGARQRLERVLAAYERILGTEHHDTLRALLNLAGVLRDQGDLAGARLHYERALAAFERTLDSTHYYTLYTHYQLFLTLLELDPRAAPAHLDKVSPLLRRPREQLSGLEREIVDGLRKRGY